MIPQLPFPSLFKQCLGSIVFSLLAVSFLNTAAAARTVTISNDTPRYDVSGGILPIGDGNLLQHQGLFYLYGVKYAALFFMMDTKD
jgi:hypothetical protein